MASPPCRPRRADHAAIRLDARRSPTDLGDKQRYAPCRVFGDRFTKDGGNATGTWRF